MKTIIEVNTYENLFDYAITAAEKLSDESDFISVIMRNEDIPGALGYLFGELNMDSDSIDFYAYKDTDSLYHGVSITKNLCVGVEPIKRKNSYVLYGAEKLFIDEDVPQSFINYQDDIIYETFNLTLGE